jgi:hypothetical protein
MGWNNYKWAWNLRGVTASEQLVCLRLADEANVKGVVDKLSHNGLQRKIPGLSRRRLREIVATLHNDKGLIKTRIPRKGARGQQISNGYELNLKVYHPKDPTGAQLWRELLGVFTSRHELKEAARLHSEGSTAYYTVDFRLLSVFIHSPHAYRFFESQRPVIVNKLLTLQPAVSRLEFLLPGHEI